MVYLEDSKEGIEDPEIDADELREERRRTGRYVATGTAIILSLLGLNQSLARGSPEYAILFLPALGMFIYVLWRIKNSKEKDQPATPLQDIKIIENVRNPETKKASRKEDGHENNRHVLLRTYSVA
ncbi:hypothetical protein WA026_020095 [Henosepilachna vigintioctopunctata]|uniref:Uncharacterized protein n=1 Tax=Henosepilachna vigintioctopunctata TaxID=420089 RepID=A0AAW1UAX3_9CUCU